MVWMVRTACRLGLDLFLQHVCLSFGLLPPPMFVSFSLSRSLFRTHIYFCLCAFLPISFMLILSLCFIAQFTADPRMSLIVLLMRFTAMGSAQTLQWPHCSRIAASALNPCGNKDIVVKFRYSPKRKSKMQNHGHYVKAFLRCIDWPSRVLQLMGLKITLKGSCSCACSLVALKSIMSHLNETLTAHNYDSLWKQHFCFFFSKKRNTFSHELSSLSLWGLVMPDNASFYLMATWRHLPSNICLHHVLQMLRTVLKCQTHLLLQTTEKSNQLVCHAPDSELTSKHPYSVPSSNTMGPRPPLNIFDYSWLTVVPPVIITDCAEGKALGLCNQDTKAPWFHSESHLSLNKLIHHEMLLQYKVNPMNLISLWACLKRQGEKILE